MPRIQKGRCPKLQRGAIDQVEISTPALPPHPNFTSLLAPKRGGAWRAAAHTLISYILGHAPWHAWSPWAQAVWHSWTLPNFSQFSRTNIRGRGQARWHEKSLPHLPWHFIVSSIFSFILGHSGMGHCSWQAWSRPQFMWHLTMGVISSHFSCMATQGFGHCSMQASSSTHFSLHSMRAFIASIQRSLPCSSRSLSVLCSSSPSASPWWPWWWPLWWCSWCSLSSSPWWCSPW
mmetsp:Transcript_71391/g.188412  ORF Transcript_71391/g.188412 Transcript_71391/m.188412 type:complete len:233 (-) Transcript_71391:872-1570(-)